MTIYGPYTVPKKSKVHTREGGEGEQVEIGVWI